MHFSNHNNVFEVKKADFILNFFKKKSVEKRLFPNAELIRKMRIVFFCYWLFGNENALITVI